MDEKVEAVARALCKLDGQDPDRKTRMPGGRVGFQAAIGNPADDGPPLWQSYKAEAEKFVSAAEALAPFMRQPEVKRW